MVVGEARQLDGAAGGMRVSPSSFLACVSRKWESAVGLGVSAHLYVTVVKGGGRHQGDQVHLKSTCMHIPFWAFS